MKKIFEKLGFTKEPPLVVRILCILFFVSVVLGGITFLGFLLWALITLRFEVMAIMLGGLLVEYFLFLIARALWQGKNWSRVLVIVYFILALLISGIGIVLMFIDGEIAGLELMSSIVYLGFYVFFLVKLMFDEQTKKYFGK
jgi:hypothetical protein